MPVDSNNNHILRYLFGLKQTKKNSSTSIPRYVVVDLIGILEFLIIFLCAIISNMLIVDNVSSGRILPGLGYIGAGAIGAALGYLIMRRRNHYNAYYFISRRHQTRRIFNALASAFAVMIFFAFMLQIPHVYSRVWLLAWFVSSFLLVSFTRGKFVSLLARMAEQGNFNKHVIIIGEESLCSKLKDYIESRDVEAEVIACFCSATTSSDATLEHGIVPDQLQDVIKICQQQHIDQVILALPSAKQNEIQQILLQLGKVTTYIDFCPSEVVFDLKNPGFYRLGNIGLYNLQKSPMKTWGSFSKRILDLTLTIPSLIILSPLMLIIAATIRLTTKGNIFFIQDRHGLNGSIIRVIKFQTMSVIESGDSAKQATKNDSRITPIGRILRRTSLDELPQLINVLRGDMSLVGPRPHPIKLDQQFSDMVNLNKDYERMEQYANRHKVKPGITGWAQVHGYRGETDTREKMANRIKYDLYYINHWSIWLDLKIIRMTFGAVIKGSNAY